MTDAPLVVFVLQIKQPLTVDPAEAMPRADTEVVVLAAPGGGSPLREDVSHTRARVITTAPDDWETVIKELAAGKPFEIAANDEYALPRCQELRDRFGLVARHPRPLNGYLDKLVMKQRLAVGGVETARFAGIDRVTVDPVAAARLLADLGTPVVVKPRQEANSRGVELLSTVDEVVAWQRKREGEIGWHVEEFLTGDQYHVNALVRGNSVTPIQVGRYLGPLLNLQDGRRLGGISVPDGDAIVAPAHAMNERVVRALGGGDFVVHTEFMVRPDSRLTVLEVAARAPGAMVSEMSRLRYGVQMEHANLRLQMGVDPGVPTGTGLHAGWVWVPVMPGESFTRMPSPRSESDVHVRRAARSRYEGSAGTLGASVLLWNTDLAQLNRDVEYVTAWDWT